MAQPLGEQAAPSNVPIARPEGREEVTEAALRAASLLFAEHQPSQVSVRQIARAAGVSHALVHRYLGSKDSILAATLEYDRREAATFWKTSHGLGVTPQTFGSDLPPGRFLKTVMRAALDGVPLAPEQMKFPNADDMSRFVAASPVSPAPEGGGFDPRLLLSATIAMAGGMAIAEDFFLAQTGLDVEDRPAIRAELERLIWRVMSLAEKPAAG